MDLRTGRQALASTMARRRKWRPNPEEEDSPQQDKKCEAYQTRGGICQKIQREMKGSLCPNLRRKLWSPQPRRWPNGESCSSSLASREEDKIILLSRMSLILNKILISKPICLETYAYFHNVDLL